MSQGWLLIAGCTVVTFVCNIWQFEWSSRVLSCCHFVKFNKFATWVNSQLHNLTAQLLQMQRLQSWLPGSYTANVQMIVVGYESRNCVVYMYIHVWKLSELICNFPPSDFPACLLILKIKKINKLFTNYHLKSISLTLKALNYFRIDQGVFFQFEIIIHVVVISFHFIWISMLWVYSH